jgi:hypothetical protein
MNTGHLYIRRSYKKVSGWEEIYKEYKLHKEKEGKKSGQIFSHFFTGNFLWRIDQQPQKKSPNQKWKGDSNKTFKLCYNKIKTTGINIIK